MVVYRHDRRRRLTLVLLVITSLALISLDERGLGDHRLRPQPPAQDVVCTVADARRRRDQPRRRLVRRRSGAPTSCRTRTSSCAAARRRARSEVGGGQGLGRRAWPSSSRSSTSRASTTPPASPPRSSRRARATSTRTFQISKGSDSGIVKGYAGRGRRHQERRRARRPGRVGVEVARDRAPHRRPQLRCGRPARAGRRVRAGRHRDRAVGQQPPALLGDRRQRAPARC